MRMVFAIFGVTYYLLVSTYLVNGNLCIDGAKYGYKDSQEPSITEDNQDGYYLTGTVWYSSTYGRFDCCGLIKAFDVKVSYDSYIEFQVWKLSSPVTTTATFKANYRTFVASNGGAEQTVTLPFDRQIPVREGDALGWIEELFDTVRWSTDPGLLPPPDSGYLWEDVSGWGLYNKTFTFAYHPASFSTLDNQHTFTNNGGENRVFGIRAVVNGGNTVTFDELPLTIAVYTTSHVVGDLVYTVLYSGGSFLEMALYVNLDVVISPNDGHFIWDNNTNQVKVGSDLITASFGTPYNVTVTLYDGCHDNQTSSLSVYVFDDRPQTPVCTSGLQIAIPPASLWDQTQEETIATGIALIDPRWRIPFSGAIEAIEVCVTSSPVDIEIQLWQEIALANGVMEMVDAYVFRVSDTGCPATKVTFPLADQIPVKAGLVLGWREANGNAGILAYRESNYLPSTSNFLWVDLSAGVPPNYAVTGNPFQFDDAGFYRLNSFRDYGFQVYLGQGQTPSISGLPNNLDLKVGDYVKGDVITSFTYSDVNVKDVLNLTFSFDPPTGEFIVNDTGSGKADVLVDVATLDGLEGNTYLLKVEVTDGCTSSEETLSIHVYVETTTVELTRGPLSQVSRRSLDPSEFWMTQPGYAVITVCTGLGLAIIATIIGLGRMCCKYFGAKNTVYNLKQYQDLVLNNQVKQISDVSSPSLKLNNLESSLTSPLSSPRTVTPRNINFAWDN